MRHAEIVHDNGLPFDSVARGLDGGGTIWEGEMAAFDSVDEILEAMEAAVRDEE